MEFKELERRLTELEAKVVEIEGAMWKCLEIINKNQEIMDSVHDTFQNLNAYLMVNVGPPLFVE
tara:strand:- start:95715 stop:95906 length:192 start_codon:yes stop_codon:yes gene_type:complete